MIYLAAPYNHPDPQVVEQRMRQVCAIMACYAKQGCKIYTPLMMHFCLNSGYDLPTDFSFWEDYCLALLRKSESLIVLKLEGWDTSQGVLRELQEAELLGIPITYI